MVELADILRRAGPEYVRAYAGQLLPSHRRAMNDIVNCRTPALGGSLYRCDDCGKLQYRYHSCRNRHCPRCQDDRAQKWLEQLRHIAISSPTSAFEPRSSPRAATPA